MKSNKADKEIKSIVKQGISFYQLLWLLISTIALSGIALLWIGIYSPLKAIISGILITLAILLTTRWKITLPKLEKNKITLVFVFIIIAGLALRLSPWMYLEGGQDEGLYVSMSKQFDRSGKLYFNDITRPKLTGGDLRRYDRERGWKILGLKMNEKGDLYYGFYPLHPMMMSVAGYLGGENHMVFSITFFSLLSIIGIFLLTKELSGSSLAGTIAASFLAFSPLHLYFSRFPVTEVIALAITLNALYFILRAFKTKNWSYLFISLLVINMFFYTRITWIISLPFYVLLLLVLLTYAKEVKEKIMWGIWGISLISTYLLSVYFYYSQITSLYEQFYSDIFQIIPSELFYTLILLLPGILYVLSVILNKQMRGVFNWVGKNKNIIIYLVLAILTGINLWYFYRMAFTREFIGTLSDTFWGMADKGWIVFKDTALLSLLLYITPVGAILFILSIRKTVNTPQKLLLMTFLFLFLFLNFAVNKFTPYQFYYARYQLSEIIPVIYIFIAFYLADLFAKKKFWFYLCLGFLTFYNLFFVAFQYQGYVGTTPMMFKEIQSTINKKDIVFYHDPTKWGVSFIVSPLKYFYNVNVVIAKRDLSLSGYLRSLQKYNFDRYILSTVKLDNSQVELVKTLKFEKGFYASTKTNDPPLHVKVNDFQLPYCSKFIDAKYCAGIIPIKYHLESMTMYLYKIK